MLNGSTAAKKTHFSFSCRVTETSWYGTNAARHTESSEHSLPANCSHLARGVVNIPHLMQSGSSEGKMKPRGAFCFLLNFFLFPCSLLFLLLLFFLIFYFHFFFFLFLSFVLFCLYLFFSSENPQKKLGCTKTLVLTQYNESTFLYSPMQIHSS